MEESASQIFLQLATGAVGGTIVRMAFSKPKLSRALSLIVGAIGGAIGCLTLEASGWAGVHLVSDLASSTLGGAFLVLLFAGCSKIWRRKQNMD